MTWDECYVNGLDKREAAIVMGCDRKTAHIRLSEIARRAGNDTDAHSIAWQAARPTSERASYPTDFIDLNQRINDHERNVVYGPVSNAQRNILAAGLPFAEITPQYGTPSHPHETVSRAQAEFDAIDRYRARWAEIELQEAA